MIVTGIIQQKRDSGKQNVFIDGEFAFSLVTQDIRYFKLKEGECISEETCAYIKENLVYIKAQDTALHYMGYKMRTEKEVRGKLAEKGFSEEVAERVMEFLRKYSYCDDRKYAEVFVRERLRLHPKGAYALQMELKQKGISEEMIQEVLQDADMDEVQDAAKWIEKRTKGQYDLEEKEKRRLYGFLQRKGYRWSTIEDAFRLCREKRGE